MNAVIPSLVDNDHPPVDLVEAVKRRFPTDAVSQRALDLRYGRRTGPPWSPLGLDDIHDSLVGFLKARVDGEFAVSDVRWLTGGASKIQAAFTLDWEAPGRGRVREDLLLSIDPPETLNTTYKQTEFEICAAAASVLPVPRALWADSLGEELPGPALIYSFATGVTKPSVSDDDRVSGLGTTFGPDLRDRLAPQFVEHLAALHNVEVAPLATDAVSVPEAGTTQSAQERLNMERSVWELDRGQDHPAMEVAASWMERNLPVTDKVGIVHGDYRSGNFLFDEETGEITAWLDWELGHVGDRHEDLAYCTHPLFGGMAEDGKTFLASGVQPREEFFAAYEQASGLRVDQERVRWFAMLATYSALVRTLATPYRVARLGRSHQDILLTRLEGVVPLLTQQLVSQLKEVI
ncbi:phosphotransferase family protein [Nocardioides sp. YJ-D4]